MKLAHPPAASEDGTAREQILGAFTRLRVGDEFYPVGLLPFIPNGQRGHAMARVLGAYVERVSYGRYRKIMEML